MNCFLRRFCSSASPSFLVGPREAHRFIFECLRAVETRSSDAELLARVLVEADCQGHYSHGINRLEVLYVKEIEAGVINLRGAPKILKKTSSTAWVDGDNCLGPTVGTFCMDLAIEKAKESGLGWVSAKSSNHFGITGWYAVQALQHNCIGMAFTNTSPLMAPTRASTAALGTNTIAVAAPALQAEDSFQLDIASTTVACGKVEMKYRAKEPLPANWLFSTDGRLPADEAELYDGLGETYFMYPLGGPEATAGYKGYGLGMMVEIFCGILAGGAFGPNVRHSLQFKAEANLGQTFIALNPAMFAEGFRERASEFMRQCRDSVPMPGEDNVIVPGDKERQSKRKVVKQGGILYNPNVLEALEKVAHRLKVKPLEALPR